jgi:peptidoglycan/LPS O-acetylase OafA/YrhL
MTYSRSLDGLRGLAILLVLFFHYEYIVGFGWVGVQLFFVLSGYLITSLLLKEKEHPFGFYLKRFYWRRTLRIFPIYYLYLLFVAAIFLLKGLPEDFPQLLPFLATYTFNFYPLVGTYSYHDVFFTHFWSLSVEEQFYLMWPAVIYFCTRNQLKYVLIAIICTAPIVRYLLAEVMLSNGYDVSYTGQTVYRFTFGQWDGFAYGALIPVFSLQTSKWKMGPVLLMTSIGLAALGIWTNGYKIAALDLFQHVWTFTLWDFFFFILLLVVVKHNAVTEKLFGNSVMVFVGKISYGLYVYHWFIMMSFNSFIRPRLPNEFVGLILYLAGSFGAAVLSYYIFERGLLSLKDRFYLKPA